MTTERTAIVVGGGLGGLTVSTSLSQQGWKVQVYEQSDELRMFGAGIWLWGNGLRALNDIGVRERVLDAGGQHASAWEIRGPQNRLIWRRTCGGDDPLYVPTRLALYEALIDAAIAAGVSINCGVRVVSADQNGTVRFEDGSSASADLVVASDGVRSRVRESLGLIKEMRATGVGMTRLLVPRTDDERNDDVVLELRHGPRSFMYNPCTPDQLYLSFGAPVTDTEASVRPVNVSMWQREFPEWAHIIGRAKGVDAHWDELTAITCRSWSKGRVAIIGDAAHGLPPTLGQAANLAFNNAVALAHTVSRTLNTTELPDALRQWERTMRPLTDHTQKWSEIYNKIGHFGPNNETLRTLSVKYALRLPGMERNLNRAARSRVEF